MPDARRRSGDHQLEPGRPEVGVIFGVTHINAREPMHGFAVLVGERRVRLVDLTRARDGAETLRELDSQPAHTGGAARLAVQVRVAGATVDVTAGGDRHRFALPAPAEGFYGVRTRGTGYVSLSSVRVNR
jgi:hypothetical protein